MFRTKKVVKGARRIREEDTHSPLPEEDLFSRNNTPTSAFTEEDKAFDFLRTLSPPSVERREDTQCHLESKELRNTLRKLGNSLYYLASIIPDEDTWICHFVDTPPHKDNLTKAKDEVISISATLTSITEQPILLPFGDKPMECGFPRQVEFSLTCDLGRTNVEAYHICERGVHKLIFPEEVTISGREYNLRNILPVHLEH